MYAYNVTNNNESQADYEFPTCAVSIHKKVVSNHFARVPSKEKEL